MLTVNEQPLIYITDPRVLAIPVYENNEILINIKETEILSYGLPPECELTKNDYTWIRKTVFEKLCAVQADLPNHWRLRLYEGFRSLKVQQLLFDDELQRVKQRYPHMNFAEQFHEATRLVSPVMHLDGSANIPAHNTGGAVDVEIIDRNGKLIDMGMTAAEWCSVDPDLCLTNSKLANKTAQKNRHVLLETMQAHGFVNYPTEWWHFSYGDRYWAYFSNIEHAVYGSADHLKI